VRRHDLNRLLNKPGSAFPANSFLIPGPKMGGMPGSMIGRRRNRRSSLRDQAIPAVNAPFSGIFWPSAAVAPLGAPALRAA